MDNISLDTIIRRGREVAQLNTRTYAEIARDPNAVPEAAIVVAIVAISAGIGNVLHGPLGLLGGVIAALLGWVVSSAVIWAVGTRITGTPTTEGSLESVLRSLGYAAAPNVFLFLGVIWIVGGVIVWLLSIWTLVTTILAIRASLNMTLGRAILTGFVAMVASWIIRGVIGMIFGLNLFVPF